MELNHYTAQTEEMEEWMAKKHFAGLRMRESESLSEKQGQKEGNKSGKIYKKKSFKFVCGWIFVELYRLRVMVLPRWLPATIISAAKSIWETFAMKYGRSIAYDATAIEAIHRRREIIKLSEKLPGKQ